MAQREQVFKKSKDEVKRLAVDGAALLKKLAEETDGNFTFEYSPESFPGTEVDYAVEVCNAVLDVWKPDEKHKAVINIPTTVQAKTAVIAYEPIWAIGTGKTATTEQAQEVCAAIRVCIGEIYDEATAEAIRIQYGGSVNAGTAAELFAQPDIDGGLVGGAALKPDFGKIVNYK